MSKETTFFTNEEFKEKMEANYQQTGSQLFYSTKAEDMKVSQTAREKTQESHEQIEQISEIWY